MNADNAGFNNATIHLHSHSFYELICCRSTCGVEYLVGSQRYKLEKGDILIVPPRCKPPPHITGIPAGALRTGCTVA